MSNTEMPFILNRMLCQQNNLRIWISNVIDTFPTDARTGDSYIHETFPMVLLLFLNIFKEDWAPFEHQQQRFYAFKHYKIKLKKSEYVFKNCTDLFFPASNRNRFSSGKGESILDNYFYFI